MNRANIIKILVCCIMLMFLGYAGQVRSAPDITDESMLDIVGRQDPFKMVTPIIEAKRNIIQKMVGSKTGAANMELEEKPDLFVETVMLKFLKAANVELIARNLTSNYGTVGVDKETNSLIICDSKENLQKIIYEIRKADRTPKQILIEVVIVDVQLNDETEIGVNWEHMFGDSDFGTSYGTDSRVHSKNYNQIFAATSEGGLFGLIQNGISVTVHALQQVRNAEILASPKILVLSGHEAEIKTVEEIAYTELGQSPSAGGTAGGYAISTTKFKDAGITLKVKPTVTDEGKILIDIEPEQSVNTGVNTVTGSDVPVVEKRTAKTTLLMRDGQVAVLGGLRKKETRLTNDRVPLLGDLPLIGLLFSNDKTEVKLSELVVFISPHIYTDGPLSDEEMKKFNELRTAPSLQFPEKNRPEYKALDAVMPSYLE